MKKKQFLYVFEVFLCHCISKLAFKNWINQKDDAFDWTIFFEKVLDANGTSREKQIFQLGET